MIDPQSLNELRDAELASMAADPELQRELSRINAESSATEADE